MTADTRAPRLQREMARLLTAGVAGKVFPGAAACVAYGDANAPHCVQAVAGSLEGKGEAVSVKTLYDIASLTKPVVAVTALRMKEAGKLDLDLAVIEMLTDLKGSVLGTRTLRDLLTHRSGLDSWGGLYLDVPHDPGSGAARRWIVSEAARRTSDSREPCLYSDLGYIVAGEVIARANRSTLEEAVRVWTTAPLGLADELFYASERRASQKSAAPTERCDWRGRIVRGDVHDENCAALGGAAGHAGLFANAASIARFGWAMLDVWHGRSSFLAADTLHDALRDPGDGTTYRLGWDTPTPGASSAGKRISPSAFGHLGFTGTSLWCDPERDMVIALLSNRVHPSRANEKIKGFRPAFHDGVYALFDVSMRAELMKSAQ